MTVASGMLIAASFAILTSPVPQVYLGAIIGQSLAIGYAVALLLRRPGGGAEATSAGAGGVLGPVMLGTTAALVWLLLLVPMGALPLAFIGVITTLIALRRKVRA